MKTKYMVLGGVLAGGLLAVIAAVSVSGKVTNGGTFPVEKLSGVYVGAGAGHIVIEGGAGGTVQVSPLDAADVCEVTSKISGRTLKIERNNDHDGVRSNCRIKLPAQLALEVSMAAGTLDITGISGPVAISKIAGEGHLSGLSGDLKLEMTAGSMSGEINPSKLSISGVAGKIKFTGLTGGASVERDCGGLDLAWATTPSSAVNVKSDGGTATFAFPADAKIKTELKTKEKGRIRNDFSGAEGTLVSFTMYGGDVNIIKAAKNK